MIVSAESVIDQGSGKLDLDTTGSSVSGVICSLVLLVYTALVQDSEHVIEGVVGGDCSRDDLRYNKYRSRVMKMFSQVVPLS